MKHYIFFTIIFLSSLLYGQHDSSNTLIKFGISATLEKSSDIYIDGVHRYTDIGFSKILIPLLYKTFLKIEPECGYRSRTSKDTYTYKMWQYGIGVYYYFSYKVINMYFGPRYGLEKVTSTLSSEEETSTNTYYNYGMTLGFEYHLSNNFSFGSEFQINKYVLNEIMGIEVDISHYSITPVLYLSVYLNEY